MRRRMLASLGGAKLPYDAEVDYLMRKSNNGGAISWIDLGFMPTNLTDFKAVVSNGYTGYYSRLFGDSTDASMSLSISLGGTWRRGAQSYSQSLTSSIDRIEVENSRRGFFYDGVKIFDVASTPFICRKNAYLFMNNWITTPSPNHGNLKIHSVTIGGDVNMELIPVRKDGVGYMYDRVSGLLFGNAGSVPFIIGPDK